jgi:hypothetical protein
MALRTRNAVLLAKIESPEGTDATPSAATDAILVQVTGSPFNLNPNVIETNEATGSLDGAGPIIGGMKATISYSLYMKGSGAAGTAPECGSLLKACGWAETVTAAAIPAAPEACQAGGSATTAKLGSTAGTTAQQYRGMPLELSSTVTASTFITDYTTGKVATVADTLGGSPGTGTSYQIPANVLYTPGSTSIPSLTKYLYLDGLLYKFLGCRGSFKFSADAGGVGKLDFTFSGIIGSKTDAALPAATFDDSRPPVFRGGKMSYNRSECAVAQFSLDSANTVTFPDDPNQPQGFGYPIITARKIAGNINPLETLVASRDIYSDFVAGTRRIVHARYGGTAGNRIGITIPQAQAVNFTPGDRSGLMETGIPFEAVGADAGAFLCFY